MRIIVGCEESGVVSAAFRKRGHEAVSCDILGTRGDSAWHITGDVFRAIKERGPWDMGIFFPPCTHLASSGARWFKHKLAEQYDAIQFVKDLYSRDIPKIALENPIGVLSTYLGKPTQIIQPWMFGHRETKATCLWLKNLPPLVPTDVVGPPRTAEEKKEFAKVHRMPPGPNRARDRSKTYQGVADAMAAQWG